MALSSITPRSGPRAAATGVAFALGLAAAECAACDRAGSALEERTVGVTAADVVAIVEAARVGGGPAAVQVVEPLKGAVARGARIEIRGVLSTDEAARQGRCGVTWMDVGKRYIVRLFRPVAGSTVHHLIDPVGGSSEHSAAEEAAVKQALARQRPASTWKTTQLGVEARLVVDVPSRADPGETALLVLFRNTGAAAVDFAYRSWPEAEQSRCALDVTRVATKTKVAAKEVPIAKQDIADYFSKHGRRYDTKIAPGEAYVFRLPRVTSAVQGYGYKEELGFRYYPVEGPGLHRISASCVNFFGRGSVVATDTLDAPL